MRKASFLLSLFQDYMPEHYKLLKNINKAGSDFDQVSTYYKKFESISIDYGIMEKISDSIKLIPARFDWNDIETDFFS